MIIPLPHLKKLTLGQDILKYYKRQVHTVSVDGAQVGNNIPIPHLKTIYFNQDTIPSGNYTISIDGEQVGNNLLFPFKKELNVSSTNVSGAHTVSVNGSQIGNTIIIPQESVNTITKEEITRLIKTELEKSFVSIQEVFLADEHLLPEKLILTGNAAADDFTVTSTLPLELVSLPYSTDKEAVLELIKIELEKSDKVATYTMQNDSVIGVFHEPPNNNEHIAYFVRGATGNNFTITSTLPIDIMGPVWDRPVHAFSEQEILIMMKTELDKSDKFSSSIIGSNEITFTGNAGGDDFTITSTMRTDIEILPPHETEQDILTLIKTELEKSDKISTAVLENNEITFTGNAVGDDFTITSTFALDPIVVLPLE